MNSRHLKIFLVLSLAGGPAAGFGASLNGIVRSDDGRPLAAARIELEGRAAVTDENGAYAVAADPAEIYRLRFSADGHFPMVHSFSALDLTAFEGRAIPPVTLVRRAEGRIMLAFGGDAMMGRRFSRPNPGEPVLIREEHRAADTLALLDHIRPYLELADYTSVNLETQILAGQPEGSAPKSYVFYSPPETLYALKAAGVDYVTLGNNHTFDYLGPGLDSTIAALDATGLGWSGAGRTEAESLQAHRTSLPGLPLSFLGYVGWAGNFSPNQVAMGGDKGGAGFGTAENVRASVRRETEQGFLPVIQYHGSREYTDEPTLATETRLKQAIDDGAILAIAHHPHVAQGFEIYRDRLIAYSMGNFIFDQVDYATQRSYLVFVWMDRDRLHRAEIMPLHIKGYVPVPATDTVRQSILRRTRQLSARRGVELQVTGGHAMIIPGASTSDSKVYAIPDEAGRGPASVWPLMEQAWWEPPEAIESGGGQKLLLGRDLLPTGHLESHYLFDAPDRSWIADGAQTITTLDSAPSGRHVMRLEIPAGEDPGRIGMRTFERTFVPGTPTTFVAWAKVDGAARITAHQQWRKRDDKLREALANNRLRPIGRADLEPGAWQQIRFDFDSPRVTAVAYRIVLTVEPLEAGRDHTSWFDDLSLIEWLGPPLDAGRIPAHLATGLASHAGFASW